eukprot:gene8923-59739_t
MYGAWFADHAPRVAWEGYDGAEGIEKLTSGRVRFLDITLPELLPERARGAFPWLMTIE